MNELNSKSAGELAQLIQKKEVSSREVVEAHLDRIKEVNPEINAVTIVLEESALKLADEVDNSEADEKEKPFFWSSNYYKREH
jgi:Asp-tRNA(Asn)/Glu-tRNA(Gln) amidotransferase A subunit family amidase